MFESLVITLREGVEATLAIGIILAYLRKTGREELNRSVYTGVVLAVAASIAGAVLLQRFEGNQELFEGGTMLVAAVLVSTMVFWMWRTAKHLKHEIESKVEQIAGAAGSGKSVFSAGLLAFTFIMVFREGIETVIFLSAVKITTDSLLSFFGGLLGLALAVLFGIFFFKGSLRIDLGRFFKITGIVLLIFVAQLLIGGIHEFAEGGILPLGRREMAIVGPIVRNNVFFVVAILAIPLIALLMRRHDPKADAAISDPSLSAPERRKLFASRRRDQSWRTLAGVTGLVLIVFLGFNHAYSSKLKSITPPTIVAASGNEIVIPENQVQDGNLHRFGYKVGETTIRFLAMKTSAGSIGVAYDACAICGTEGYVQEGKSVVCLTCVADINNATIGVGGGCNPIPLHSERQDGNIRISLKDLLSQGAMFAANNELTVVDPVCGMHISASNAGAQIDHHGTTYYFCKMPECAAQFRTSPEKFVK